MMMSKRQRKQRFLPKVQKLITKYQHALQASERRRFYDVREERAFRSTQDARRTAAIGVRFMFLQ